MTRNLSTRVGILSLALAAGGAAPLARAASAADGARAANPSAQAPGVEVEVPLYRQRATFRVEAPDAAASPAARDDRALTRADGSSPGWTAGYQLTSRVIVRSRDERAVRNAAPAARLTPASPPGRAGPLAEFFYLDVGSVRAAAALADAMANAPGILEAYLDIDAPKSLRNNIPTDPGVPQQWHLVNATNPLSDINAEGAWKAGFTGAGVTVGVLESGWDITHEDLAGNYHAEASQPGAGAFDHGTATAGLVAAVANNNLGGAGVAHGARISRLYYGNSSQIAQAFGFRNDLNKIKTNSWGPFDNGFIAYISSLELAAIEDATLNGRAGRGEVIVWAAGNGGENSDRLDYDSYGANRFSMAVGSIDFSDRHSTYSEPGSPLMLVTTSDYSLSMPDVGIYSSWGFNTYTASFGGTSAAAPIAAGVAAMVLEANPNLGWRDVQHVMIRSARRVNPADPSWSFNGAGAGNLRAWSEYFGFGAIDAGAATALAQTWTNRPPLTTIAAPPVIVGQSIPDNNPAGLTSSVALTGRLIVERVQLTLHAPHSRIGQLRVTLTSPSGTVATLAALRSDNTAGGYNGFTFNPAQFWDERAAGTWTLKVADEVPLPSATGSLGDWQLSVHGYEPACPCDWNLSGDKSLQDLFDFLTSYFNNRADFSGDGLTQIQDLFDFLACWFGPC